MPAQTPAAKNGTTTQPAFIAVPLASLPKREGPKGGRPFDAEAAKVLFGLVSVEGQTASDGVVYAEEKLARGKANAARRLLAHAIPVVVEADGNAHPASNIKSQVYTPEGTEGFRWAVYLVPYKASKPRKKIETPLAAPATT